MNTKTVNNLTETRLKHVRRRLSKVVRIAMAKQDLSQVEVCNRTYIHPSTLSEIMNEKRAPNLETITRLEAGLGMNIFEILEDPEPFEV